MIHTKTTRVSVGWRKNATTIAVFVVALVGALASPAVAWDKYTEIHPDLVGYDSSPLIQIDSAASAASTRAMVQDYFWPTGMPLAELPSVSNVYDGSGAPPTDLVGLNFSYIASADKLDVMVDYDYHSYSYFLESTNTANAKRLAVVHAGHTSYTGRLGNGVGTTIDHLLSHGFSVLAMQMPVKGWNTPGYGGDNTFELPGGTQTLNTHDEMTAALEGIGGSSLRYFIEPVVVGINQFIADNPDYVDISMMGLSGGGWTTDVAAAVDTRIKTSIGIAGSHPLYIRYKYLYSQDSEQLLPELYEDRASYLDLYILDGSGVDGHGEQRKHVQLLSQYDSCCFYGVSHSTYVANVEDAVTATGSGEYEFYLDTSHTSHMISSDAITSVINPELGITGDPPPPPPGNPPSINDNFDDESGAAPPGGWSYDPRNGGGSPTITENAGIVTFSDGAGVVSIVHDTAFDPQQGQPVTGVLQVESLGADDAVGFYLTSDPSTRDSQVGIHILSNGKIGLNADPGGGFNSGTDSFTLTTLSGYAGGQLELTLAFCCNGFTASTDFGGGWSSGLTTWESLGNGFDLSVLGTNVYAFIQAYDGAGVSTTIDSFSLTAASYVPVPGDADGDGRVDEDDAAALAANWLQSGVDIGWADGDFNGDGVVNDIDVTLMAANWGYGGGSASVPEPSTLAGLLGLCLAGLLAVARRKRLG